ncbi:type II secretion system F family protein [bacterium]|nr:type II secretion system F family protein [bacterium]
MSQNLITIILFGISALSIIGTILVGVWIFRNRSSSKKEGRINHFVTSDADLNQAASSKSRRLINEKRIGRLREWINSGLNSLSSEELQIKLSSAYWPITDKEYILVRVLGTILAFLLGWFFFNNFLGGLFLSVLTAMIPPILLDRAIAQRQKKFHEQLLDVLILIKGAVQAGYSLMQALDLAVEEVPAPASEEFGRILREIQLGITLEQALMNLSERMENDDLQIVVTAIIINNQVGGNLSTVLESTISTIRDRMHLFAEIRSLTSYSRYVGNFLTLMPFITGLAIFFLSPGYFDTVKTSLFTQGVFIGALLMVVIGNVWIRKLVKIKV